MGKEDPVLALLKARGFKFKKQFGQNFIFNSWILNQIVDFAELVPNDIVVEVGSGAGTLTEVIAMRQAQVISIELDKNLIPILQQRLKAYPQVHLIQGDVMSLDLDQVVKDHKLTWPYKIVANLPYQISTPFLTMVFRHLQGVSDGVVLVQKEVANKVVAKPGTEGYGMLSLAAAWFGECSVVYELEAEYFTPAPPVDSALLRIKRLPNKLGVEEKALWTLIRGIMNQRRKNLLNGLKSLGSFQPKNDMQWQDALAAAAIPGSCRGEELSIEQFADIVKAAGYQS
jgi:16S rRNA (adenine1518-N6/adenine1519-N6)-dimethyltransferase